MDIVYYLIIRKKRERKVFNRRIIRFDSCTLTKIDRPFYKFYSEFHEAICITCRDGVKKTYLKKVKYRHDSFVRYDFICQKCWVTDAPLIDEDLF